MDYRVRAEDAINLPTELLILPVFAGRKLHPDTASLDQLSDGFIARQMQRGAFDGMRGESLLLLDIPNVHADRILLIGCGRRSHIDSRRFVKIAEHAAKMMQGTGARKALCCLTQIPVKRRDTNWKVRQLILFIQAHIYRFDLLKSRSVKPAGGAELQGFTFLLTQKYKSRVDEVLSSCKEASSMASGISYARDLGNLPGNICTPNYLADEARKLAESEPLVDTSILDEDELRELGCGALLAVSQGSQEPGCLIIMKYNGGDADQRPIALVGKGVTFDTGGLSIKPAMGMIDMKFDMCGAASVFGTMKACVEMALPINVVAVVAAAENMPGSRAVKPNDIITTLSGRTVEVLNTDAEGRLVLCDALTYVQRFEPFATIDIATLTGACRVALGRHVHGMFSNSTSLSNALEAAGRRVHDSPWPMPLMEEYQRALDSKYADMTNVGGSSAGAITAACFLWRFARDMRWAHLDIAGTAADNNHKGATGRPVALLTQYLIDRANRLRKRNKGAT